METKLNFQAAGAILLFSLYSCTKVDFEGMFIPAESANDRFEQSIEWNKTHPSREIIAASDDYFILSIGDSHVGSTRELDSFLVISDKRNPAAVVVAGDLTNGLEEEYNAFEEHISLHGKIPVNLVAGNHDMNFDGWPRFYSRFGSSTYFFTVKTPVATDLFICLESGSATLGSKQIQWLTGILKNHRNNFRHCVVCTHNNFFLTRHVEASMMPVEEMECLMTLFHEYNVEIEITAHDHKADIKSLGGTKYIVLPALKEGPEKPGYLELEVNGNDLSHKFIYL